MHDFQNVWIGDRTFLGDFWNEFPILLQKTLCVGMSPVLHLRYTSDLDYRARNLTKTYEGISMTKFNNLRVKRVKSNLKYTESKLAKKRPRWTEETLRKPLSYRYHAEKGITLKANTQRGITQRGITQGANTQKGITQRGITHHAKRQYAKRHNTKRQHAKGKRHRKKGNLQSASRDDGMFHSNTISACLQYVLNNTV